MARHRHPPAPGARPATRDPAAAEGSTVADGTGAGHRPGRGLAGSRYRAAVSGRDPAPGVRPAVPASTTVMASLACRGWSCAAVPVMARGPGTAARSPATGCAHVAARVAAPPWPGGRLTRQHLPRRPGLPGEPGPFRVPASARQPADVSRGARLVIRAAGTREPAVTAGTVPTGRPSSCRAWEPGRGRRICGRTPVTREGSRR